MNLHKSEKLVLSRLVRVKKGAGARKVDVSMPSDKSSQDRIASRLLWSYLRVTWLLLRVTWELRGVTW